MRRFLFLILLVLAASAVPGQGETWDASREIHCAQHRPNCRLLQMVMMGSFDIRDPEDAMLERVLASARPLLAEIAEEDIRHFATEFGEDVDAVRLRWYGALANCLRAEIGAEANPDDARRVLALFLETSDEPDPESQRAEIHREMTDGVLSRIADTAGVPVEFVRWLVEGD